MTRAQASGSRILSGEVAKGRTDPSASSAQHLATNAGNGEALLGDPHHDASTGHAGLQAQARRLCDAIEALAGRPLSHAEAEAAALLAHLLEEVVGDDLDGPPD